MGKEIVETMLGGCFNGEPASCSYACPFRADLRAFLKKAAKGRWDASYKDLRNYIPFLSVTSEMCHEPCRSACQQKTVLGEDGISMKLLERASLDFSKRKDGAFFAIPQREEKIAVIGAGMAGLSCALLLSQKKYRVTVFDRNDGWGGRLRQHGRFPAFNDDISIQFKPLDTDFRFGTEITELSELDEFDAVYIATGNGGSDWGLSASADSELSFTSDSRIFLGGELTAENIIEAMAGAMRASKAIEAYLQTGNPGAALEKWDRKNASRFAPHSPDEAKSAIIPEGDCFTSAEAQAEAARCLQCDCTACMNACELMEKYRKKPPRIAVDVSQDGQSRNSVSKAAITRQTWSCNLCSRCSAKCSCGTDIAGMFQYSRCVRVDGKLFPPALHHYWMRELDFMSGDGSLAVKGGDYAFFPGCRLGAAHPDLVLKPYAALKERLNAGLILNCCGISAWWAGEEEKFKSHIEALRSIWTELGKPTLITACMSCDKMLSAFLPEIKSVSLYTVLRELGINGEASSHPVLSVFDPCAANGRNDIKDDVRALVASCGAELTGYNSDGKCCGNGGHMRFADNKLYDEIVQNRISESEAPFAVYCANCRETFRDAGKDSVHVLELLFGIDAGRSSLEEKRENVLKLKEHFTGVTVSRENPWDIISATASDDVIAKMNALLVPMGDVKAAIYDCMNGGGGFRNESGDILTCRDFGAVVLWVSFKEANGGYTVTDVYTHRMHVRQEG